MASINSYELSQQHAYQRKHDVFNTELFIATIFWKGPQD